VTDKRLAFTTQANGIANALKSNVVVFPVFNPDESTGNQPGHEYSGIWDTGATGTVITQRVVNDLSLKPLGMINVSTPSGTDVVPWFLVSLGLPNGLGIRNLRVSFGKLTGDDEVLIGMDVIGQGDFAVSNFGGKTSFTFRTPPTRQFDFVVEEWRVACSPNDPCPCGSTVKFKKCHGRHK